MLAWFHLQAMYDLLVRKPEGEAKLLRALVNKLGDPNRKIGSKAGFLLSQLLVHHPVMKPVVAAEVGLFASSSAYSATFSKKASAPTE
jgi:ribosome biogenesis protein MAK21